MQGSLKCLVTIARNCPNLQFLSLATLSNIGHSGSVALLQEALSCCHQLRDFSFVKERPGLIVSLVPFHGNSAWHTCQSQVTKYIPVVHLKELFLFGTSVATSVPT
ncbi:F-box and leucine-rich repeat protein 18 [Desmophyllum pertusum]|uniref:F-box and leucine-rich repeat protein 18 n=1 Tax=Desmophyllum pertusum TaxID=174260 RepID=A0A9X0CMK3_9CNID|nr:F-box and leucine-rich repeat protein 18 [Desmophyllum pertusum]